MNKMFGFSRRRMKIGRLKKVQLSDSSQGIKSPMHHPKRGSNTNGGVAPTSASSNTNEVDDKYSSEAPIISNSAPVNSENWMVLSIAGDKPTPRFNHAATVIGNKMLVVGGESGNELLDDVQVLNFDRFTWTKASSKIYMSPSSLPLKIPGCKGHSLVSWGKKALLIGGKTDPATDKISVWAFDTETECWSLLDAKGDIPAARSGHTVVKASSVLILFGGEDAKKRKLNDLHMFDLKSLTWLPLHCTGTGPSSRSNHVATLYDDKTLLIFGGSSKSKTLNDLYSLDFETMIWSRVKIHGYHPSPRAGCCGVLCGTKWYIAGGGSRKKRIPQGHGDTLIFDVLKLEWSVAIASPSSSITTNKGFSLVLVQHKEKDFLVAFGGSKKEPSNQVEVLIMEKNNLSMGRRSTLGKGAGLALFENRSSPPELDSHLVNAPQRPHNSSTRQNLASVIEQQHGSGRKSLSEYALVEPSSVNVSLRKQYCRGEDYTATKIAKRPENEHSSSLSQSMEQRKTQGESETNNTGGKNNANDDTSTGCESELPNPRNRGDIDISVDHEDLALSETEGKSAPLGAQQYETQMVSIIRKNGILEEQLAAAVAGRESAERTLSSVLKNRHEMEKKLADAVKEVELLQEKLASVEFAQEEANGLSNIVHSDNVRLEHDVAFLKAVLDDTQKELHSTRGVLAGERARAFQLQVEVFHLKQRLQSMENRAPTPRKPFHV